MGLSKAPDSVINIIGFVKACIDSTHCLTTAGFFERETRVICRINPKEAGCLDKYEYSTITRGHADIEVPTIDFYGRAVELRCFFNYYSTTICFT